MGKRKSRRAPTPIQDGTLNLLSPGDVPPSLSPVLDVVRGLGLDTISTHFRATRRLEISEIDGLFGDGIGQRIVQLPVDVAFAGWPTLHVEEGWKDEAAQVEALAETLEVPKRYRRAEVEAQRDGSAVLIVGYADGAPEKPAPDGREEVIWIRSVPARYFSIRNWYGPESRKFGAARTLNVFRVAADVPSDRYPGRGLGLVHGTRFFRLSTETGESAYQQIALYLANLLTGSTGASSALARASLGLYKIKNWQAKVDRGGADGPGPYETVRAQHASASAYNCVVIDANNEEYEDISSGSLGGLESGVYALSWLLAAAAGIPMMTLYGISPGGFASGEGERKDWLDRARARRQAAEPAIRWIYDRLWAQVLGEAAVPPYELVWPEIEEPTELERIDLATKAVAVALQAIQAKLTTPEAVIAGLSSSSADLWAWVAPVDPAAAAAPPPGGGDPTPGSPTSPDDPAATDAPAAPPEPEEPEEPVELPDDLATPKDLAQALGISPGVIHGMGRRREVMRYPIGRRWYYSRRELHAAIVAQAHAAALPPAVSR